MLCLGSVGFRYACCGSKGIEGADCSKLCVWEGGWEISTKMKDKIHRENWQILPLIFSCLYYSLSIT